MRVRGREDERAQCPCQTAGASQSPVNARLSHVFCTPGGQTSWMLEYSILYLLHELPPALRL